MRIISMLLLTVLLSGCAGGPTHDYYSPALANGPKLKGPITMSIVDDVQPEKQRHVAEGYTFIGETRYAGDAPKANELKAQAKRVHANLVIYSVHGTPAPEGSWHFSFGGGFGSGGTGSGYNQVDIVFMGK
jgi:hypothetical protein